MKKKRPVDINKIIALPLVLIIVFSAALSLMALYVTSNVLEDELISRGLEATELSSNRIISNIQRIENENEAIEEKMMLIGEFVISNRDILSNDFLEDVIRKNDIRHVYWYNPQGVIVYDGTLEFVGWMAKVGDPIHDFLISGLDYYKEDVREDTDNKEVHKNIYIRANDGYFVQVGIAAQKFRDITEEFRFQNTLESLVNNRSDINSAKIMDVHLVCVANTIAADIREDCSTSEVYLEVLQNKITLYEKRYNEHLNTEVLDFITPLIYNDEVIGILVVEFSLDEHNTVLSVLATIFTGLTTGFIIFYVLTQNFQVVSPLKKLNTRISKIDINKVSFREENTREGAYTGLYNTLTGLINKIVDSNTKNKQLIKEGYNQLLVDHLTNIPNRFAAKVLITEKLNNDKSYALMFMDIDDFKAFNDTKGHEFGDELLIKLANMLSTLVTQKVFVARYGGDEFVFFQEYNELLEIGEFLDSLCDLLNKPIVLNGSNYLVNASVGISLFSKDGTTYEELIKKADIAMYNTKGVSRTSFKFYEESMSEEVEREVKTIEMLKSAIEHDGFELVYQPQVDIESREIVSIEALLRLKNENISPGIFIPLAEKYRLMNSIGRIVIKKAIEQIAKWTDEGREALTVYINFSALQLDDERIVEYIKKLLKEYNVRPELIGIEITETIIIEESEKVKKVMGLMTESGFKTAIDDFGSGQAGINYLSNFQVDTVKLDKSFSDKYLKEDMMEVFHTVIHLCNLLGFRILAEGIETKEQVELLKTTTCKLVQGYYYFRPSNPEKIAELLEIKVNK